MSTLPDSDLFVAELGNGSLGVIDLQQGKLLDRIKSLKEPQGVSYDPGSDTVHDPNAIDALRFSLSLAFIWPAIARPRQRHPPGR